MTSVFVPEATARPPGFDITIGRVMDTAARNVLAGNFHALENGIRVLCTERFWDDHAEAFANALFSVLLLPSGNAAVIRHIGLDDRLISETILHLRKECESRSAKGEPLMARIGWLVRGSVHKEHKVALDWGGSEHLGSVLWFASNGWLKPTGKEEANSLGGTWPCAVVTQKGREYVESMPPVVVYKDRLGIAANDPAGWLIDHSSKSEKFHRWIRN